MKLPRKKYVVDVKTMRPILLLYPSDSAAVDIYLSVLWGASNLALNLRLFLGTAGGGGGGPGEKQKKTGGFCLKRSWVL